ncbi:MAG: 4-hydroxy-tetrahydrodipicolinate reductase [Dokdonella sp.]|jgi:4-hydroxy-tetrahydrodipicolinate reductase|nr:4-hydroxy-tetrahydrodipicolinate reductase [Dokdonella sp.]MBP6325868.1 4-hydroxy-tetrahydrodipicolinate reductase [Dokdonella sp.]MBP6328204.1 4-hydroxy-tetrahydrodipicolinate reductase [Dokdonella sp.]
MGQALLDAAAERTDLAIVAALVRADASAAVEPAVDCPGVPFSTSLADETGAQVLVDFSGAAGFDSALELALERKLALVSGSTGLSGRQSASLLAASERIPVLWAANFSLGVAVLAHVAAEASRLLPDWDCEILEAHHRNKQDAPSGTALMLGERVRGARGTGEPLLPLDRKGLRPSQGIGFSVMRGGDIIGEHEVRLVGSGERIELVHRATDRRLFARGALVAARWLCGREPGRYTLESVLGL